MPKPGRRRAGTPARGHLGEVDEVRPAQDGIDEEYEHGPVDGTKPAD
jgi:hypothetical protein